MNRPLLFSTALAGIGLSGQASGQPNVIYIFPDQMRNHAMGFWSQEGFREHVNFTGDPVHTPNLDRFARESAVLTSATSTTPVSSPHRAMLLTGMYAERNGVWVNCNTERPFNYLREDAVTIGDVFSGNGYQCAYFGKYHLDYPTTNNPQQPGTYVDGRVPGESVRDNPVWDAYTPPALRHGFDYWYSYGTFDVHKNPHYWDNDGVKHEPKRWSPEHEADKIIDYLRNERDPDRPLLLMWSLNPPHSPYASLNDCMEQDYDLYKDVPLERLLVRPNARTAPENMTRHVPYYFSSVTGVDRAFGRVIDALKALGLDENTLVVFSSDHGDMMCSHDKLGKGVINAESFNVPFLIRYPGRIAPHVSPLLLSTPDVLPTLLNLAGLGERVPSDVQGKNLSGFLTGEWDARRMPEGALFIMNGFGEKRDYRNKLVLNAASKSRGVKTADHSLCLTVDLKGTLTGTQFFDDRNDPYQMENLDPREHPEAFANLCRLLGRLLREADDPWFQRQVLADLIPY